MLNMVSQPIKISTIDWIGLTYIPGDVVRIGPNRVSVDGLEEGMKLSGNQSS